MSNDKLPVQVLSVVTSNGLLSGIGSWSIRLSEQSSTQNGTVVWRTLVLANEWIADQTRWFLPPGARGIERFDYDSREQKWRLEQRLDTALASADVVVPNYCMAAWDSLVRLRLGGAAVRCLGVCHSDHAMFYQILQRFEPVLDAIAGVSRWCTERVRELIQAPIPIVLRSYGVSVPPCCPIRDYSGPLRLIYVGRLIQQQKRVLDLVELARRLLQLGTDFTLDVAGEGPDQAALAQGLAALESPRIRFHGPLPLHQVGSMLERGHVQLLVSDHEGMPVVLLEGMAAGLVPVATQIDSGIPELVQDDANGYTTPVGDMRAMAELIDQLSRSRDRLAALSLAAHESIRRGYDLASASSGYFSLCCSLCTGGPRQTPSEWAPPLAIGFGQPGLLDQRWVPPALARAVRRWRHPDPGPPARASW